MAFIKLLTEKYKLKITPMSLLPSFHLRCIKDSKIFQILQKKFYLNYTQRPYMSLSL